MKLLFRDHGYLNSFLATLWGMQPVHWFQPESLLLPVMIILIDAWRVTPLIFLIVLVALEQLPESFLDAARVDGAGFWQIARYIQIPLVVPALLVAVALRAVDAFQIFATPLVLVGVEGFPVVTSVAYHYQMEANNPAAANVAALSLAFFLLTATLGAFWLASRGKTGETER
jgi:multiple sugar transport system permease protein